MSKKLLFNGCSMTAGDAVTWSNYYPDVDFILHSHFKQPNPKYSLMEIHEMYRNYILNLRPLDNLSGQVHKLTGQECTDLSEDGNSNQNIAMTTISFLSQLSLEERKNYHVCVGWSALARKTCWNPKEKNFYNVNIGHLEDPDHVSFHDYIKEVLINASDIDHVTDYFSNIILLQSYLKANNITYTFWNTIAYVELLWVNELNNFNKHKKIIPYKHELLFDSQDWIAFSGSKQPWLDDIWSISSTKTISKDNLHPNLEEVIKLAKQITEKINNIN